MSRQVPHLTDRAALERNRARAGSRAMFLHELAMDEIKERLELVNRTFTDPAIVTGFPDFWADMLPGARVAADTERLDLAPGTHDLVIHAMSLHWANDPLGQIFQSARALRPDGLFLACLFGGQTLSELRQVLGQAETEITGGLSPRIAPMADIRDMGGLLQRAGLTLPVADCLTQTVTYRDARALMLDLQAMGENNALAARHKAPLRRDILARAEQLYRENFPGPDGTITAQFDILFLAGWSPHPDQPQPLRRGSATHSLAEALERVKKSEPD